MWNGGKFERPAARVREMALFLRKAFANERVVFQGETFSVNGFRFSRPLAQPIPDSHRRLASRNVACGRRSRRRCDCKLALGRRRQEISPCRPRSRGQSRKRPNAVEITARLFIAIDPPTPEADLGIRRHINTYLNVPVYKAFQKWLGRETALAPMWQAWDKGDRKGAVAAVPTDVMNALVLNGSTEEIRAHIRHYMDAGVDTAFLQFQTFEDCPKSKA